MARNVIDSLLISLGVVIDPKAKGDAKALDDRLKKIKESAKDAKAAMGEFGDSLRQLGGLALKASLAVGGLFAGLATNTMMIAEESKQIERQAKLLGLTTDAYQELTGAAGKFGVDTSNFADVFAQLSGKIQEGREGASTAVESFNALGISMEQLQNVAPDQIFALVADGLNRVEDSTKATAIASRLLGEEGFKQMGPLLKEGAQGIDRLRQSHKKAGLVLSKEQLAKYRDLNSLLSTLKDDFKGLRQQIATAFLPSLTKVLDRMKGFINRNREAIVSGLERWVERVGEWFEWLAEKVEDADRWIRETIGWSRLLLIVRDSVMLLAGAFLAFRVGGVIYTGFNAVYATLGAIATILGVGMAPAAAIIGAITVAVAALALQVKLTFLVFEDWNAFLWETKDSLIGLFVDSWAQTEGPIGSLARGFLMLRDLAQNNYRTFVALTSIIRDGFALAIRGAGKALTALANSPAGQWIISWADTVVQALQPVIDIMDRLAGGFQSMVSNFSGALASGTEGLAMDIRGRRLAAEGVPAPMVGPMSRTAAAPAFPAGRSGQPSGNITSTTTINVAGGDPLATARAVAAVQQAQSRAAIAKARGGNR